MLAKCKENKDKGEPYEKCQTEKLPTLIQIRILPKLSLKAAQTVHVLTDDLRQTLAQDY